MYYSYLVSKRLLYHIYVIYSIRFESYGLFYICYLLNYIILICYIYVVIDCLLIENKLITINFLKQIKLSECDSLFDIALNSNYRENA